jgi:putative ABC transport system permease protein
VLTIIWLRGLLGRRGGRLAAAALGITFAVALLAALGSFLGASKATMTKRAIQQVAVDWQVQVAAGASPDGVLRTVKAGSPVSAALEVGYAATPGFTAVQGGTTLTTGAGMVLGLPTGYQAAFPGELRFLAGTRHDGVLLAQQTAANLHASVGDTIAFARPGLAPVRVRVDAIVDLPQADSLFQKVGAVAGAQPSAPPDNVLLLPAALYQQAFGQLASSRPDLVQTQWHVRLAHALPADPAAAFAAVSAQKGNAEARLAGTGLIGDNLGAALGAAREDALYAQMLFLFLGVPGAVLAGLLTVMVAGSGADRRRREQALLRARGASSRQVLILAAVEALAAGLAGSAAGLLLAAAVGRLEFGSASFGASGTTAAAYAGAAAVAGLLIAAAAVGVPAWRDQRDTTVTGARRAVGRPRAPRWLRYGVDFWLLGGAAVVFWATSRNGYQIVLVPEGLPTLSVSYWAFAGPALLWAGAALLTWRITDLALSRGRGLLTAASRPLAGRLSGTVSASLSRQRTILARTVTLLALAIVFAASTATFDATYRAQARADALLTNGADVTVTVPAGARGAQGTGEAIARTPGVASVEPLQHRFAYVGADLQDLYGVRPDTVGSVTALQDAYFQGGTASQLLATLASRPDAILVSAETVRDFQLSPGDLLRLRLQDGRTGKLMTVPFHYAGIVKEFPTAPRDSFFVANAAYVTARAGTSAAAEYLVSTDGTAPPLVATRLRAALGPQAAVSDIVTSRQVIASTLTAVDLSGLTRVELAFALALAVSATALLLALGFAERRRTFALARVLGAQPRQLGGFVWTEVVIAGVIGAFFGAVTGWLLSQMLVKVLTGVFDPPPAHLSVPWAYLGIVAALAVAGLAVAGGTAIRAARRPPLTVLRDL